LSLTPFLWQYFRRYVPDALASFATMAIFAISTILLLALFQPILAEVLKADASALAGTALEGKIELGAAEQPAGEPAAGSGTVDPAPPETTFQRWKKKLDLHRAFEKEWRHFKATYGIDESNVGFYLPLIFVVVFVIRSISDFVNNYLFQRIGLGATNDLRTDLYQRILHQSSRFYAEHPSGELISRVSNDIGVMQNAVTNRLLDLFQQSLTLFGMIWFLLSIHFQMALVCLLIVPAIAVPFVKFGKGMRRSSARSQERLADLSSLVAEAVRGHRVVKAFGMERFELDRFKEAARRHLKVKLQAQLLAHGSGPFIETVAAVGAAIFLMYAGYAIRSGELKPSQMVVFLTTLLMLYDPIRKINKVNLILQEALAAGVRIQQVMELPNLVEDPPGAGELPTLQREIRFEGVEFHYDLPGTAGGGRAPVLRGIDLVIPRGQLVALVGHSGAGKSTLVNLLPRFFDPTAGRVTIDGHDLRSVTLESLRRQIGIVTQDTVLFDDTIRGNIAYGRADLPFSQVQAAAKAAFADEFVEQLPQGYDTEIGESGLKLSGGQRQRLAIARAVMKNPPILILDEATSHLDSEAESLVQKALYNLMEGRTALVIAHRLSTVQRADRILVLDAGRVVEDGRHEELLLRGGVYRRLYDLQFQDIPARETAPDAPVAGDPPAAGELDGVAGVDQMVGR
jgi:subfamily B ATP-binding cassette protein MsbA